MSCRFQLDAKKSPLALLAQTCSSIGSDLAPSTKSIIPPIEKESTTTKDHQQHPATHSSSTRKTESPTNSVKSDGRRSNPAFAEKNYAARSPGSVTSGRSDSPASGFRSPTGSKDIPPLVPISSPRRHSNEKSPPPSRESSKCVRSESSSSASGVTHLHSSVNVSSPHTSYSSPTGLSSGKPSIASANSFLEASRQHHESVASGLSRPSPALAASHPSLPASMKLDSITSSYGGMPHAYAGCHQGLPMFGHPLSMDPNPLYPSPLSAAAASGALGLSALQKAGAMSGLGNPSVISPYMSYARVKTASGATTLVPVCKDPYCTHCQLTMHSAQAASCPAGCAQCNHEMTIGSMHPGLAHAGLGSMLAAGGCGAPSAASSLPLASSLYPHSFGMLPGQGAGLPYVCNWMNGSDYCGKRFPTSEELLQHLRTHTSSAELPPLSAASLHQYASLGLTKHAAMTYGGYPSPFGPSPGSALSPSSLRQAYPRSLSPSSMLAASRYHPYKSALAGLPPAAHTPLLPPGVASALGPYYSPYSLYGHRVGSAAVP